jgi:hypothetical protein
MHAAPRKQEWQRCVELVEVFTRDSVQALARRLIKSAAETVGVHAERSSDSAAPLMLR